MSTPTNSPEKEAAAAPVLNENEEVAVPLLNTKKRPGTALMYVRPHSSYFARPLHVRLLCSAKQCDASQYACLHLSPSPLQAP